MNTTTQGIIALVLIGAGFYGGMQYQTSKQAAAQAERQAQRGQFGGRGGQNGGPGGMGTMGGGTGGGRFSPTIGTVLSKDDTTMTVELEGGGSKIILLSKSAQVTHSEKVDLATVKIGDKVQVMGSTNPDGSVTAERIMTGDIQRVDRARDGAPAIPAPKQ